MNEQMYKIYPIQVKKADGITITSTEDIEYMDTFSGIGVLLFGHSYPPIVCSMKEKMNRHMHLSNFFVDPDAIWVENALLRAADFEGKVFFTNSGTESTEAALRMVKRFETDSKNKILHFSGGFHGRTIGSLSILGRPEAKKRFGSLLPNTICLPWNDPLEFSKTIELHKESVLAIFIETIQGAGGVQILSEEMAGLIAYYQQKHQVIVVCDEIQSGLGRTGKWFAYQHWNLHPDIVLVGKGIGGGLPLGGALFTQQLWQIAVKGDHGSTFAPNPIALAGAKAVLETIPSCLPTISEMEKSIHALLENELGDYIKNIRLKGFMVGLDPYPLKKDLQDIAFQHHNLLLNITSNGTLRLLPPLNLPYDEWIKMIKRIKETLQECIA